MASLVQALSGQGGGAIGFGVSATVVYAIVAACCSSPQTAEINAHSRSKTLMKWVYVGLIQAALFIAVMAYMEKETGGSVIAVLAGGALAGVVLLLSYAHAKASGMKSHAKGTES
jgi:hypothetical protein